jgi:4-hydroxy-2-oxoheptanedioate aldolase
MSGPAAAAAFRERLEAAEVFGIRCVHGHAPTITAASQAGIDFVYLDQQHGTVSYEQIASVAAALSACSTVLLVRVPESTSALIGRALDAGADGILAPDVTGAAHAEEVVRAALYPPQGVRSWGRYGGSSAAQTSDRPFVVPMIESPGAVAEAAAIAELEGVDAVYVGRNDLALASGAALADVGRPGIIADSVARVRAACDAAGIPMATSGDLGALRAEGFRMLTLGSELDLLQRAVQALRRADATW